MPIAHQLTATNDPLEHQHDREVKEALRVQAMSDDERSLWLDENWSRLQEAGNVLYANMPAEPATARCFASMDEKNRYDREREVQFALQYAIVRAKP